MLPTEDLAAKRAAIARKARRAKHDPSAQADVDQARSEYRAAKLEDYIRRVVDQAPPLSADQRSRLALLLSGGSDAA